MPSSEAARKTRMAISLRFATRMRCIATVPALKGRGIISAAMERGKEWEGVASTNGRKTRRSLIWCEADAHDRLAGSARRPLRLRLLRASGADAAHDADPETVGLRGSGRHPPHHR